MWLKPDIKCRHENIDHIEAFRTQPTKFESSDLQVEYVTFVDENMKYNAILLNGATHKCISMSLNYNLIVQSKTQQQ